MEVWKQVICDENIYVSNTGLVKKNEVIINLKKDSCGYYFVNLKSESKKYRIYLHRLTYETFFNCKLTKKDIIHHIDCNSENNNLDNLKLMTLSEHSKIHHTIRAGWKHSEESKAKISISQMKRIQMKGSNKGKKYRPKTEKSKAKILCEQTKEKIYKGNSKNWKIINCNTKEIIIVKNLKKFCKESNLINCNTAYKSIQKKRPTRNGWLIEEII